MTLMFEAYKRAMRRRALTTKFVNYWMWTHSVLALIWLVTERWGPFEISPWIGLAFSLYFIVAMALVLGFTLGMIVSELQRLKPLRKVLDPEDQQTVSIDRRDVAIGSRAVSRTESWPISPRPGVSLTLSLPENRSA